jgi:glycosyltransferase involved in cell wall biosynthesis
MLASLAAQLQSAGCHNLVIVPANGEGWLARQLAGTGVAVERITLDRPLSRTCARWLETTLRRHRIGVAHSHEFTMAVYGAWVSRRLGIGHVITMHGSRYYVKRWRRRLALRLAAALAGHLVAVSHELAGHLSHDLWIKLARVRIIPNGVQLREVKRASVRDELHLGPTDPLLLAVGNLYPVKGHEYLIDALALLTTRHPRAHVVIAGRGELADKLRAHASDVGVSDRVHFLGLRSDIPELLAAADIFVLPSLSEGLPLALLEAMSAGRPIVATNVGEVASALANGEAGLVVPPENREALADAVAFLLSQPAVARALGERAAQRAAAEYHLARMTERYAALYQDLIRASPALSKSATK